MKSSPVPLRLMIYLLSALALTCLVSPWLALAADWVARIWPGTLNQQISFSRIFNRTLIIVTIIILVSVGWRLLIPGYVKDLIAVKASTAWISLGTGIVLALVTLALLLVIMAVADVYSPSLRYTPAKALSRFAAVVAIGLLVGFTEEFFFRGLFFFGLYDPQRPLRAYLLANLFYSTIHFVRPPPAYVVDPNDPLAGFRYLLSAFHLFGDPAQVLPGIFGLFLVGVVLTYALVRTGHLYLAVGLHAGWIIGLKMIRVFGQFHREEFGWVFGQSDPKVVSGAVTWIAMLLVCLAVRELARPRSRLVVDRPTAA